MNPLTMSANCDLHVAGARNQSLISPGDFRWNDLIQIVLTRHNQRRHLDAFAVRRKIEGLLHLHSRGHLRRNDRRCNHPDRMTQGKREPLAHRVVGRPDLWPEPEWRRHHERRHRTPGTAEILLLAFIRHPPRGRRRDQHERSDALGTHRRIPKRDEPAVRNSAQCGALDSAAVKDAIQLSDEVVESQGPIELHLRSEIPAQRV
jgi:hypothetical protein